MDNYKVIKALGAGTWGVVHMAEQKGTGLIVAIKKIKSEKPEQGVNFTAIREIKLLRDFKHENIISLVDGEFQLPWKFCHGRKRHPFFVEYRWHHFTIPRLDRLCPNVRHATHHQSLPHRIEPWRSSTNVPIPTSRKY
jgi:serine/threonine protein kinase